VPLQRFDGTLVEGLVQLGLLNHPLSDLPSAAGAVEQPHEERIPGAVTGTVLV
jgi:hypothetical protein